MIEQMIHCEFGGYAEKVNQGYVVHSGYFCIDAYEEKRTYRNWEKCPCCNLKPKIWTFDNGRSTACGCWNSKYDHFSVKAESIMSVYSRCDGNLTEFNSDQLRLNWNEYCATMINPCNHADLRFLGRW